MPPVGGDVAKLEALHRASWGAIAEARRRALATREALGQLVIAGRAIPQDTGFVVFGSLAREEVTEGSDVDWALLIDGPADDDHSSTVHRLRAMLRRGGYKDPGTGGLFGGLAISHELVHRIGGDADSNRNITQRILLLLESRAPISTDVVRNRVLRVLLTRYLIDDFGYPMPPKHAARVPRFLLNDIVRYWRTVAVEFAAKRREQEGAKWGIRNFKLRMSRKIIFAAGLIACLSCRLRPPESLSAVPSTETEGDYAAKMAKRPSTVAVWHNLNRIDPAATIDALVGNEHIARRTHLLVDFDAVRRALSCPPAHPILEFIQGLPSEAERRKALGALVPGGERPRQGLRKGAQGFGGVGVGRRAHARKQGVHGRLEGQKALDRVEKIARARQVVVVVLQRSDPRDLPAGIDVLAGEKDMPAIEIHGEGNGAHRHPGRRDDQDLDARQHPRLPVHEP